MRIGVGYDAHRFGGPSAEGAVRIGGVDVPFDRTVLAHSDGDVVVHALCDAILGAAALGDLGAHFPDSEARWRGADSLDLLARVTAKAADAGMTFGNADITLIAERPKVRAHIEAMREAMASAMGTTSSRISVKATTTEGMGFEGRGEGIAAHAVVLMET